MSDLIDRQSVLNAFDYWIKSPMVGYSNGLLRLHEMLEEIPPAKPKTGRWIRKTDSFGYWYACSECDERPLYGAYNNEYHSDYCPNCGAKMQEVEE